MEKISLAEAIMELRQELTTSIKAAETQSLRFKVGEVLIEFEIAIERAAEGRGGVKFWVLEVGGQRSRTLRNAHRLTIPLTPSTVDGGPVLTGDTSIPG
jgi:hypothetical protein